MTELEKIKQESESFKKYLTAARNKLSYFALSNISEVATRTEIDSFVIAFDQLEERYYYSLAEIERLKKDNETSYLKGYEDGFKEKPF